MLFALAVLLIGCPLNIPEVPPDWLPQEVTTDVGASKPDGLSPEDGAGHDSRRPDYGPGADVNPPDVSFDSVDGWMDIVQEIEEPPAWDCDVPIDMLTKEVRTGSFTLFDQVPEENMVYIYQTLCGVETVVSGPERAFLFQVDELTSFHARLRCQGLCYAYLTRGGCGYYHMEDCWSPPLNQSFGQELMPGLYMLAVEEMEVPDTIPPADWDGPPFDIHVALNRTDGLEVCQTQGDLDHDELISHSDCVLEDGQTWRVWKTTGTLPSPGEGEDRFILPCQAGSAPLDPVGGMPDHIYSIELDVPDGKPRNLDIRLLPLPEAGAELPSWTPLLGFSGPPCGRTSELVDCDGGMKTSLHLPDLTLLPGQVGYIYIDSSGEEAFETQLEREYELQIRIAEDCKL